MTALFARFRRTCEDLGAKPIVVILPQPTDIERCRLGEPAHRLYFADLSDEMCVIDFADIFLAQEDTASLYVEGGLGPHLSRRGNALVAENLMSTIDSILKSVAAPSPSFMST